MAVQNVLLNPGNTQLRVYWSAYASATSYTVTLATNSELSQNVQTFTTTALQYLILGLTNGTPYFVAVQANNSVISSVVTGTPVAPNFPAFISLPEVSLNYQYVPQGTVIPPLSGEVAIFVGCALDGPTDQVLSANGSTSIEQIYGPVTYQTPFLPPPNSPNTLGDYSGNSLVKDVQEALLSGATNFRLLRVGGELATGSSLLFGQIGVTSVYPSRIYNGAQITGSCGATGTSLSVIQPECKGGPFSVLYESTLTFNQVCDQFNADPRNLTFTLACSSLLANDTANTFQFGTQVITLSGGTYGTLHDDFAGTSKQAYATAVLAPDQGLALISGQDAAYLHVSDLYADDDIAQSPNSSFVTQLASFCYNESVAGSSLIGVIGVRPLITPTRAEIATRANTLSTPNINYDDPTTQQVNVAQFLTNGIGYSDTFSTGIQDIGNRVVVVGGPDLVMNLMELGIYTESGAAYMTGWLAQQPPETGLINQVLPNTNVAWQYTRYQSNLLAAGIGSTGPGNGGGAYLTFRENSTAQSVILSSPTASERATTYADLYGMRVSQAVQAALMPILWPFIGQNNVSSVVTALDNQIKNTLDSLVTQNLLSGSRGVGYDYNIISSVQDESLDRLGINLWFVPSAQIDAITLTVVTS